MPSRDRPRPAGGESRRAIVGWCLYDFANSSFTTLIVTFVYATWFSKAMAPDEVVGTSRWSWAVTISSLLIAVAAPLIGARADRRASRLAWFRGTTAAAIALTAALTFAGPPRWLTAAALFVCANVAFELSSALYNAFLPALVTRDRSGRLSGIAWGLGYAGGLLSLVVGLLVCVWRVGPFSSWLSTDAGWNIRVSCLVVAGWFLVFALPALFWLREPAPPDPDAGLDLRSLRASWSRLRRFPQALRLLIARLIYNDGLVTIFAFGGIYAAGTFGMRLDEIILFGIALNVAAGAGALGFGWLDDRIGAKPVILISLGGLILASGAAALAGSRWGLWVAGIAIGLLVGPNQSASRSLLARCVPATRSAEMFGLFAFSGKLTSFAGPFLLGRLTEASGSQRVGVASVIVFFLVGGLLLLGVDEEAGRAQAEQEESPVDGGAQRAEPDRSE